MCWRSRRTGDLVAFFHVRMHGVEGVEEGSRVGVCVHSRSSVGFSCIILKKKLYR